MTDNPLHDLEIVSISVPMKLTREFKVLAEYVEIDARTGLAHAKPTVQPIYLRKNCFEKLPQRIRVKLEIE